MISVMVVLETLVAIETGLKWIVVGEIFTPFFTTSI